MRPDGRTRALRAAPLTVLLAALAALAPAAARAGVYSTDEPVGLPLPSPFRELVPLTPGGTPTLRPSPLQLTLGELRALPIAREPSQERPDSLRAHTLRRVAELEALARAGRLTDEDRANLGAHYIRLRRFEEAVEVLSPAARGRAGDRASFMVLANLATAHHQAGRLDRALSYQKQALDAWPDLVPGWSLAELVWFRRAERFYMHLLQSRYQDSVRPPARGDRTGLDPLFPGVRFTGRSGDYAPGEIAPDQMAELPNEAIGIVEQLVLWLPFDDRLYWLLGELLNSWGHVVEASDVLDELVYARAYNPGPELKQHRQVLLDARPRKSAFAAHGGPAVFTLLLGSLQPRDGGLGPGTGAALAASQAVLLGHVQAQALAQQGDPGADPAALAPRTAESPAGTGPVAAQLPNPRHIAVSLLGGVLGGLLIAHQFRKRRRAPT